MLTIKNKTRIIKTIVLIIFLLVLFWATWKFAPIIIQISRDPSQAKIILQQSGSNQWFIFLCLQIFQVVTMILPSEAPQIASGILFGWTQGFLLASLGLLLGSLLLYWLSYYLGANLIENLLGRHKIIKLEKFIRSSHSTWAIIALCFAPFIPRDALIAAAGILKIKSSHFFITYIVSRLIHTLLWSFVGAFILENNKNIIIAALGVYSFISLLSIIIFWKNFTKNQSSQAT